MFNRLLTFAAHSAHSAWRRRPLPMLQGTSVTALSVWLLGGCALQMDPGDGIVSDGREIVVNSTVVFDAGQPDSGVGDAPPCMNVPLFEQKVIPHFKASCVECHDGTKGKAQIALNMSLLSTDTKISCLITRWLGANDSNKTQVSILTSSDPSRPDVVHDFKFKTVEEFNVYRDDIMVWVNAERPGP